MLRVLTRREEGDFSGQTADVLLWREKIDRNKGRDRKTDDLLAAEGGDCFAFLGARRPRNGCGYGREVRSTKKETSSDQIGLK